MSLIDSWSTTVPRRRFFQQRLFWGGTFAGLIAGMLILMIGLVVFGQRPPISAVSQTQNGNITIMVDSPLLTTGMRIAIKRVQNKLPVTVSDVSAVTFDGDRVDMTVIAPGPLGVTLNLIFGLAPVIDATGHIDFKITQTQLGGLVIPGVNGIVESALNDQFSTFGNGPIIHGLSYQLTGVSTTSSALVLKAKVYQP